MFAARHTLDVKFGDLRRRHLSVCYVGIYGQENKSKMCFSVLCHENCKKVASTNHLPPSHVATLSKINSCNPTETSSCSIYTCSINAFSLQLCKIKCFVIFCCKSGLLRQIIFLEQKMQYKLSFLITTGMSL